MSHANLLTRRIHADVAAPVQPFGAIVESPAQPSDALVELQDQVPTLLEAAGIAIPETTQGRSLLPILRGEADAAFHREFVRSEYLDAIWMDDASYGTMYFDGRYKFIAYHNHPDLGELYDLENDPGEFDSLWDDPNAQELKLRLMKASFDATMMTTEQYSRRIGPM